MERTTIYKVVLYLSKLFLPFIYIFIVLVGSLSFAFSKQVEMDTYQATGFFFIACFITYSIGYKDWYVKANQKLLFILLFAAPVTVAFIFGMCNSIGI